MWIVGAPVNLFLSLFMIIVLFVGVIMGALQTFIDWNLWRFLAFDIRKLVVYVVVSVLNFVCSLFPLFNILSSIAFYLI